VLLATEVVTGALLDPLASPCEGRCSAFGGSEDSTRSGSVALVVLASFIVCKQ
jgi:hypothetical protein